MKSKCLTACHETPPTIYKEGQAQCIRFNHLFIERKKEREGKLSTCNSHELWSRVGFLLLGLGVLNCPSSLLLSSTLVCHPPPLVPLLHHHLLLLHKSTSFVNKPIEEKRKKKNCKHGGSKRERVIGMCKEVHSTALLVEDIYACGGSGHRRHHIVEC